MSTRNDFATNAITSSSFNHQRIAFQNKIRAVALMLIQICVASKSLTRSYFDFLLANAPAVSRECTRERFHIYFYAKFLAPKVDISILQTYTCFQNRSKELLKLLLYKFSNIFFKFSSKFSAEIRAVYIVR